MRPYREAKRSLPWLQVVKAKDKALRAMLQEGAVQLRDGVTQLIDDALADEARIAVLCGTFSAQVGALPAQQGLLHLCPSDQHSGCAAGA